MTLYELKGEFLRLMEYIENEEYDPQTFQDTLDSINEDIASKADGYGRIIRKQEGNKAMLRAEIERLTKKVQSIDKSIDHMKSSLKSAMIDMNTTKIKTDLFSFSIAKNGGKQPLDIFADVPEEFKKIEYSIDKDRIRELLEAGQELPFAILQARGESLRIK